MSTAARFTDPVAHLTPDRWATANRALIRKGLAEFAHERLLDPQELGESRYKVLSDDGATEYRFTADRFALDHWQVYPDSISRHRGDEQLPLDALQFITELRGALGLSDEILPVYLEEISSTLAGTAYKSTKPPVTSAELAHAGFQAIETGMTEGHPCFVANNGKLGFGVDEFRAYAPEAASDIHLIWLAARRDRTTFTMRRGHRLRDVRPHRTRRRDGGRLRRDPRGPRPGPGGLPPDAGPPLAVVEQAVRHLRGRGRAAAPRLPGRGRRHLPGAAVDPYVLQRLGPGQALRQDGALGPQHGLHARPVGRVHGGHMRRSTTGCTP